MLNFDKWDFDIFEFQSVVQEQSLSFFGFKLFQQYGLFEKFSISDNNFANLLNAIKQQYYEINPYHNLLRCIEVTRNFHYFTKNGDLMSYLSDLDVMSGFLAAMLCDVGHP